MRTSAQSAESLPGTDPPDEMAAAGFLMPFIRMQVAWALHHRWQAPHPVFATPTNAPNLWLVLKGEVTATIMGKDYNLTPGSVLLCGPHMARTIHTETSAEWLSVGFEARVFHEIDLFALLALPRARVLTDAERPAFESLLWLLVQEWGGDAIPAAVDPARWFAYLRRRVGSRRGWFVDGGARPESALICDGLARSLFGLCWRLFAPIDLRSALRGSVPPWLPAVVQRADNDPSVSVADLADLAHLSPARFRVVFHDWTGTSPQQYLTEKRMGAACRLLANTDDTIASIAAHVGTHSVPTFTRLFKLAHGLTPGRYRQIARQPAHLTRVSDNYTSDKDKQIPL